jgi:NADH-quinone oxidoreductase subunit F
MSEYVLLQDYHPGRTTSLEKYRRRGGYEGLAEALRKWSSAELRQVITDSGLRGCGGAGFPTGRKWEGIRQDAPLPRYILANADEMEPGTFKDRLLIHASPHMIIEGMILAGYAVSAQKGIMFIRPSYETQARIMEKAVEEARQEGYLGTHILGSGFDFDIKIHRSGGRYICGEASAQIKAIQGMRPRPDKTFHMVQHGLWGKPTIVNNVETLAFVPHIVRKGGAWFQSLAEGENNGGTKLYCISGKVRRPGCYEAPMGTRLSEIIEELAGGMLPGCTFKACLPGGASSSFMTREHYHIAMDFDSLKAVGNRMGTGAIIVFDQNTCLVGATLNLIEYFARESCGFCTPCREGLPFTRDLLRRIEAGEGEESFIPLLKDMCHFMTHAYCAFAQGAATPVHALLTFFEEEVREHVRRKKCPYGTTHRWPGTGIEDSCRN